jgi:hypothetical protein
MTVMTWLAVWLLGSFALASLVGMLLRGRAARLPQPQPTTTEHVRTGAVPVQAGSRSRLSA